MRKVQGRHDLMRFDASGAVSANMFDEGRLFVEEVITECRKRGATRVDVLAFEFEMGLFPAVREEAGQKARDLIPKYIPAEVFDKRAMDRGEVVFYDISFVQATPRCDKKTSCACPSS